MNKNINTKQNGKFIDMIHDYLNLNKQINQKKKKIKKLVVGFNHKNFYGKTDHYNSISLEYKGFNVSGEVTRYIDRLTTLREHLVMLRRRKKYFDTYMESLSVDFRRSLERDFKHSDEKKYRLTLTNTHKKVVREILEIEEAICHEFNKELLPEYNKEKVELEMNELTKDTVEESFQIMAKMLGV